MPAATSHAPSRGRSKPDRTPTTPRTTAPERRRCRELAEQLGSRPETVALAWTLHHPEVWPSIGPRTTEQIDNSLQARRVTLTEEQVDWLRYGGR
ncbi:aldo/keto reductase [Streptomyces sp. NBC_01352]|uniref:aldo/keto reductase n=1 Tax=unclassified Streptomyces TaxID=2593676 RepID=UPI0022549C4D|nr:MULTISPECIES: aldo/keto reductase [unclassified Streptomyces]MCX4704075.1 aldo/keto reductase [Streptomyces sp. NBC_01373]